MGICVSSGILKIQDLANFVSAARKYLSETSKIYLLGQYEERISHVTQKYKEESPVTPKQSKSIWTSNEKQCLLEFLNILEDALENTATPNSQLRWFRQRTGGPGPNWVNDSALIDYFIRIRNALPKSTKMAKIFAYADDPAINLQTGGISGFTGNLAQATPRTQIQLAHLYAIIAYLNKAIAGENPSKFLVETDILFYLYQDTINGITAINFERLECLTSALQKIYFLVPSKLPTSVPADSVVIVCNQVELITGKLNETTNSVLNPGVYSTATFSGFRNFRQNQDEKGGRCYRCGTCEVCCRCIELGYLAGENVSHLFLPPRLYDGCRCDESCSSQSSRKVRAKGPPYQMTEYKVQSKDNIDEEQVQTEIVPREDRIFQYLDDILFKVTLLCRKKFKCKRQD